MTPDEIETMRRERRDTPGSESARAKGCNCPVIDNHHGKGEPYPDGPRFWMREDCPLHGKTSSRPAAAGKG